MINMTRAIEIVGIIFACGIILEIFALLSYSLYKIIYNRIELKKAWNQFYIEYYFSHFDIDVEALTVSKNVKEYKRLSGKELPEEGFKLLKKYLKS